MIKVFILNLTGEGVVGGFEAQLGNVAILIPTIKLLHDYIPI